MSPVPSTNNTTDGQRSLLGSQTETPPLSKRSLTFPVTLYSVPAVKQRVSIYCNSVALSKLLPVIALVLPTPSPCARSSPPRSVSQKRGSDDDASASPFLISSEHSFATKGGIIIATSTEVEQSANSSYLLTNVGHASLPDPSTNTAS